jgi:putative oxidoreductase
MKPLLAAHHSTTYSLLRIVAGLLFSLHGFQKIFGVLGRDEPVALATQFGLAGIIELVAGLSIAAGFHTGLLALIASGEMAVAYFQVHAPRGIWPITNGGEPAVLYCFVFLYLASMGAGRWSVRA